MLKIAYIDDLYYWIPQVINAIPKDVEYRFYYYNRIWDIENIEFDIVILDFYLDKDWKTALDIIDKFLWNIIIWFSSVDSKNDLILENWWVYKATKIKNTNFNIELESVFRELLNKKD